MLNLGYFASLAFFLALANAATITTTVTPTSWDGPDPTTTTTTSTIFVFTTWSDALCTVNQAQQTVTKSVTSTYYQKSTATVRSTSTKSVATPAGFTPIAKMPEIAIFSMKRSSPGRYDRRAANNNDDLVFRADNSNIEARDDVTVTVTAPATTLIHGKSTYTQTASPTTITITTGTCTSTTTVAPATITKTLSFTTSTYTATTTTTIASTVTKHAICTDPANLVDSTPNAGYIIGLTYSYGANMVKAANAQECCELCANTPNCAASSFVKGMGECHLAQSGGQCQIHNDVGHFYGSKSGPTSSGIVVSNGACGQLHYDQGLNQ